MKQEDHTQKKKVRKTKKRITNLIKNIISSCDET